MCIITLLRIVVIVTNTKKFKNLIKINLEEMDYITHVKNALKQWGINMREAGFRNV